MTLVSSYNTSLTCLHIITFLSQQKELKTLYLIGRILSESLVEQLYKKETYISIIYNLEFFIPSKINDILGVRAVLMVLP